MPSRAASAPTPVELAAWLRVASPRTAHGRYRWSSATPEWRSGFGYVGSRPVITAVPPDVEVRFWHAAPDAWRIDLPDRPLCVADGAGAVVWADLGIAVAARLLVLSGPGQLLHHEDHRDHGSRPSGEVKPAELLGRPCWRWREGERTLWVDPQTGCALRLEDEDGTAELTALEVNVELEPGAFALPDAVVVPEPPRPQERARPRAPFLAPWWPFGAGAHPVAGDRAVPEVLLSLHTQREDDPQLWLGIAPAGHEARVQPGGAPRRWDGDGWRFALSWRGEVDEDDLDRVVASVPRAWS